MANSVDLKTALELLLNVRETLETAHRWVGNEKVANAVLKQRRIDIERIQSYLNESKFNVMMVEEAKNREIKTLKTTIKVLEGKLEVLNPTQRSEAKEYEYPDSLTF